LSLKKFEKSLKTRVEEDDLCVITHPYFGKQFYYLERQKIGYVLKNTVNKDTSLESKNESFFSRKKNQKNGIDYKKF